MHDRLKSLLRAPNIWRFVLREHELTPKRVVVDFSSPNIAKQFHVGNLRSTLIGRFIANVGKAVGHDVIRLNYLGDWGRQFALIDTYWPSVRPSDSFWDEVDDKARLRLFQDCYVQAHRRAADEAEVDARVRERLVQMEKSLEVGDDIDLGLWREARILSARHLRDFYARFGVTFDVWSSESEQVIGARRIVDRLIADGLARLRSDGLWLLDLPPTSSSTRDQPKYAILRKSDGTSLYISRELASLLARDEQYRADQYIYVVDRAQERHFETLKLILNRMDRSDLASKILHVSYGRVKGLSTRLGRSEAVPDLLDRGTELALDFIRSSPTLKVHSEKEQLDVAGDLAVGAITLADEKRARRSDYEFTFRNAFDPNNQGSIFYLQQKHSRLRSIEKRNQHLLSSIPNVTTVPEGPEATALIQHLGRLESVLVESESCMEACRMLGFVMQLARLSAQAAAVLTVQGEPPTTAASRLMLLSAARRVLADSMLLLGVRPLDEM